MRDLKLKQYKINLKKKVIDERSLVPRTITQTPIFFLISKIPTYEIDIHICLSILPFGN